MIPSQIDQETIHALAGSDLHNLAEGLAEEQLASQKPAAAAARSRGVIPPIQEPTPRPECRPVAVGGMFATLHPECNQDYLERFQHLRTQLMLHRSRLAPGFDVRTLAVMSTRRGEGKSFTATNLAATLAGASNQGVLLIDGNPEGSELPLGVDVLKGGLTQALLEPDRWADSIHTVKDSKLSVMPRGRSTSRVMDFTDLPKLLAHLRRNFEWIVLDGTSFATAPDAEWMTSVVDGALLVTQGGAVDFSAFQDTLMRIPQERLVGVVFNQRAQPKESFRVRLKFSGKWNRFAS